VSAEAASPDEWQLLQEFFNASATGWFVEVGLRNPASGSRVHLLENAGWTGVIVDPRPDVAAFLVSARKARIVAAACVAPDEAGRPLTLRLAGPLSSFDMGEPGRHERSFPIEVPARTLDDILGEAGAPKPLDLLTLDVQGRELDALLGLDFGRWKPRLIVIADDIADLQRHRFLKESGYALLRRVGGSGWYVPADSEAAARRERWPVLRDYYLKWPLRKAAQAAQRLRAYIKGTVD
jgi:FkbM family methyltransferase